MNKIILSKKDTSRLFLDHVKKTLSIIPEIDEEILISGDVSTSDLIQAYILLKDDYFHENIFKPIILKESIESEIASPGSGEISLILSLLLLEDLLPKSISGKKYRDIQEKLKKESEDLVKKINLSSSPIDKKSFSYLINRKFKDPRVREIVKTAISLSGSSRKISVKRSNKNDSSIKIIDGYNFSIFPDKGFLKNGWKRENVNCVIIDGAILEVSEIHHLLTYASESKEPYVLFVRGLSPDVKNTIFVNNRRGTIDVLPIEIPVDEKTINIFSDLGAVCGCDITSSYKGDLISKAVKEKISIIDSLVVHESGISIRNKATRKRVAVQVREIMEKRREILEPQNRVFHDERIKSLSSGRVDVEIGYLDQSRDPVVIENIDKFFRSIPVFLKFGILKRKNLAYSQPGTNIENFVDQILKNRGLSYISSHAIAHSVKRSTSIVNSIISTGCILPYNQS